ncbi:fructose-bisphosphate aldolase class II [Vibrio ponticus]|nr:fructose-bisphosphate aldolase class II [Vibrio ponticus]
MPYISGKQMIAHAVANKYAVGAFSAHNLESVQAILDAANETQSPVMIQIGQRVINTHGIEVVKAVFDAAILRYDIPVCIHLDHCHNYDQIAQAIRCGFDSVMFDGSQLSIEDNIHITRQTVQLGKALNIGVEGEIGKIGGTEDDLSVDEKDALITTVEEAKHFVDQTGVDYLAVSCGTAHGVYTQEPKLALERLAEITQATATPLVLHGGSGVPDQQVRHAIEAGIAKVNVDTELRQAFVAGIKEYFEHHPTDNTLAFIMDAGKVAMKQVVVEKINLFGSANQAASLLQEYQA